MTISENMLKVVLWRKEEVVGGACVATKLRPPDIALPIAPWIYEMTAAVPPGIGAENMSFRAVPASWPNQSPFIC